MLVERIGVVRSCFGEKFGVPRQPGLCPSAWGTLTFDEPYRSEEAVRGLDEFSHVWIVFLFHQTTGQGWHPTVRPPRLGGNRRVGVFASRSPFRPNSIGLSVVRLEGIDRDRADGPVLLLGGMDLVDGTPVLDVKPYIPYADSVQGAVGGYALGEPPLVRVVVDEPATDAFDAMPERVRRVIIESLALDARPAVHHDLERVYGVGMCGFNVRFRMEVGLCRIIGIDGSECSGLNL